MNEIIVDKKEDISNMIYEIRGVQVIFDYDLAKLYGVETKRINEAVKNNPYKFPERFSWNLTKEETSLYSRSKFSTLNEKTIKRGQNIKYLPRVFTEQGVAMRATILKSKIAIEVSINIMDTFVAMRKYVSNNLYKNSYILVNHENRLLKLEETFDRMQKNNKINAIFYNGQIYDSYSILMDILNQSKKEIIIIDNYAGKELLDMLRNIDKKILIISKNIDDILITKYKNQYSNVEFKQLDIFHDRFIIIDREKLYNFGASFKDLGKKCFAINKMQSNEILNVLLDRIIEI